MINTDSTSAAPVLLPLRTFLKLYSLSRSEFYRLCARGEAPDLVKIGRRTPRDLGSDVARIARPACNRDQPGAGCGMSAYSTLARAVDKIHHAEEQKLTAIRHAIQKAITANELEGQRTFDKLTDKRNPNWAAVAQEGHHTNSVRAELKNALETVEACIQQHWERERHEVRRLPPLVQLLDFATEPQRALVAEEFAGRFLAHREKARLRDRRYRERKALPAPEGAAELPASAENATPATPQAQWLTTQIRQAVSEIEQHGGKLDTVAAAQR